MTADTIRIFVGCAPNHEDAESQAVLEYSIRSHASRPVEITWMKHRHSGPFAGWDSGSWATPFSGFRYALPTLCDRVGRAIYMDSDVIVMADVAELIDMPMRAPVMALSSSRLCVSLWDCARAPALPLDDLRRGLRTSPETEPFPDDAQWNCLDGGKFRDLRDPRIKAIHYTSMPHQPHLARALIRLSRSQRRHWFDGKPTRHWREDIIALFDDTLAEAELAGYTVESYCRDPIFGGYRKGSNAGLQGAVPAWGR